MMTKKQTYIGIGIVIVIALMIGIAVYQKEKRDSIAAVLPPGHWLAHISALPKKDTCGSEVLAQLSYIADETLSTEYTFEKYAATGTPVTSPAPLNIASLRSASEFRTKIGEALKQEGVNFAGHYSIVSVGMTGSGNNYWIVDRTNGKAYEFPYKAIYLTFTKDSNLIVMDSKEDILTAMQNMSEYQDNCAAYSYLGPIRHTELRPFYFVWENNELKVLGPTNIQPKINTFWKDYFAR